MYENEVLNVKFIDIPQLRLSKNNWPEKLTMSKQTEFRESK